MAWKNYNRPNKYNNRKTTVDGIKFDSIREAERYQELKLLEEAGRSHIWNYSRSWSFRINLFIRARRSERSHTEGILLTLIVE